jgi:hypothetical protein
MPEMECFLHPLERYRLNRLNMPRMKDRLMKNVLVTLAAIIQGLIFATYIWLMKS